MTESFNLITSRWLPVRFTDDSTGVIRLKEMAGCQDGRIPDRIAFADQFLNDVALELLAGILQMVAAPDGTSEWVNRWNSPPSSEELKELLGPLTPFFYLFGPTPAFQVAQASTDKSSKHWPIRRLVRDTEAEGSAVNGIGLASCAVALFGLQSHAHSGGSGYGTSLSGGGPIRTIPAPEDVSLFKKVWSLILDKSDFNNISLDEHALVDNFPWMFPRKKSVLNSNGAPGLVFFATPRNLLLTESNQMGVCPFSGQHGPLITKVIEGPHGAGYESTGWRHPFTPYRHDGKKNETTPMRAANFPNGFGYNDRVGIFYPDEVDGIQKISQADIIRVSSARFRYVCGNSWILPVKAYGQRYDNAKHLGSLHSEQELILLDDDLLKPHEVELRNAVAAATVIEGFLLSNLISAQISDHNTDKNERKKLTETAREQAERFWSDTQLYFDNFDNAISHALVLRKEQTEENRSDDDLLNIRAMFLKEIARTTLNIFDETLPYPSASSFKNYALARHNLTFLASNKQAKIAIGLPIDADSTDKTKKSTKKPKKGAAV